MTNEEVYRATLNLVGETNSDSTEKNTDYREHGGYFLAMVCRQCEPIENAYRQAIGQSEVSLPNTLQYSQEDEFPLSEPFSVPVAYGVAALLTADENPDLSGEMHTRFCKSLEEIRTSLPMRNEPIVNRYPLRF